MLKTLLLAGAAAVAAVMLWPHDPTLPSIPGAINPAVTQDTIYSTICVRGWTRTVRPPVSYTERLKREQVSAGARLSAYEEDHLIPLALGGAPYDPRNLWAEPRYPANGWTARKKDWLEGRLAREVCDGRISLDAARRAIATDWHAAYRAMSRGGFSAQ
jgi:hypothetical protein